MAGDEGKDWQQPSLGKEDEDLMVKYDEIKLESEQQLADIFTIPLGIFFWISSDLCLWVSGQRGSVGN